MRLMSVAFPAILLASCGHAEGGAASSSAIGSRTFAVANFDKVALQGSDNVNVLVGKDFSVSAKGPEDELERLEILVDDGVLKIGRKSGSSWHIGWSRKSDDVTVTVTMPAIQAASLAGSGDMTIDSATSDSFKSSVAGSGNLKIGKLEAKSADLSLAGSGDIVIAGKVGTLEISGAGSGNVAASALEAETADISLAGSGNVDARATGSASVSVMGSGDVTIFGTDKCKTSKLGSGSVSCKI
ncbi:MAG: head GIN domain-containing protein [Sphingomonadaceae bacterium]